jgi:hypothetical protein
MRRQYPAAFEAPIYHGIWSSTPGGPILHIHRLSLGTRALDFTDRAFLELLIARTSVAHALSSKLYEQ